MTTTDKIDRDEVVAKALADLEALRQLDICDPFELTRPFRQFAVQLSTIGETLAGVGFAATIDDEVRRRVENVLDEMDIASHLIETAADSVLSSGAHFASPGVRTWFEAALNTAKVRASLTSDDVLLGTEQTAAEAGIEVEAELAGLREAIKRGDIVVPRTLE